MSRPIHEVFQNPEASIEPVKFVVYVSYIGFAVYLCNDSIQGRSATKRICQQQNSITCFAPAVLTPKLLVLPLVNRSSRSTDQPERKIGDI